MSIAARNAILAGGAALPYDAEVEWISSNLNQNPTYNDARVAFIHACTPNTVITYECMTPSNSINIVISFGYRYTNESQNFLLGCANNTQGLYLDYGSGYGYKRINMYAPDRWMNRRMKLMCGNNYLRDSLSGVEVSGATQDFDANRYDGKEFNIWIRYGAKTYGFSLTDNGIRIVDFIPVRFTNENGVTEGAMFDRANPNVGMNHDGSARDDGLYRNLGTGAFVIGPDASASNGGV